MPLQRDVIPACCRVISVSEDDCWARAAWLSASCDSQMWAAHFSHHLEAVASLQEVLLCFLQCKKAQLRMGISVQGSVCLTFSWKISRYHKYISHCCWNSMLWILMVPKDCLDPILYICLLTEFRFFSPALLLPKTCSPSQQGTNN